MSHMIHHHYRRRRWLAAGLGSLLSLPWAAASDYGFQVSPRTGQLILGLASDWDSSHVTLRRFSRTAGSSWREVGSTWSGRLGAKGLIWGRGLHQPPPGARLKREGDGRAPVGAFALGVACGYESDVARHAQQKYFQVSNRDLWVEDPSSEHYNKHLRLKKPAQTPWELKQRMKLDDPAHALKLFIAHNADIGQNEIVSGGGSSIFFHIWRAGGTKPSSGCTTMAEPNLRRLIEWIDPTQAPIYVLLTDELYGKIGSSWGLP
jgi:L,D-peptidoglycan transpeptidase YkuD (ErfK/YbiS/YcfS/YnhG family)